jgi:hypothetical protein
MSSNLIGGYLTFYLNQPIKWADFRLDALLADTMLTKLYNGWLLKFSLGVGFEQVFIFSVTLDTRKNERHMSVSTIET